VEQRRFALVFFISTLAEQRILGHVSQHFGRFNIVMTLSSTISGLARLADSPPLPPTRELIESLQKLRSDVSDIFLSPMRLPEVRAGGQIIRPDAASLPVLVPEDTRRIASDLIGNRPSALPRLEAEGSCHFSCFLAGGSRFRVNIFSQRGSYAIALRAIPDPLLPTFETLMLPSQLARLTRFRSGLVIVSGPAGAGKSSTLAAILGRINEEQEVHIVTIEDPIEFQFRHSKATVLQRELHRDVPSFPLAIRSALRHPPHVIFLSAIPGRETMDAALEAADCGHLVFAALHTPDVSRTLEHILRFFSPTEERVTRARLGRSIRAVVSQRLLCKKDGNGQTPVFEILFSTARTRECMQSGEEGAMSLTQALREEHREGMQCFEDELRRLHSSGVTEGDAGWEELYGDAAPPHGSRELHWVLS
jgi:twitching motility protein PilT